MMAGEMFGRVKFGDGATWNPFAKESDEPHLRVAHSVLDVMVCLRGASPNMNLGNADSFFWAGEWGLALDEIQGSIEAQPNQSNELAETMLARARAIMADGEQQ
jgi:hypothetical protein